MNKNSKFIFLIISIVPFFIYAQNNVGIGTVSPTSKLHVKGSVRFQGLTVNNNVNQILGIDTTGNVYYKTDSSFNSGNWHLTGNANVNSISNFLGTLDTSQLVLKTNNIKRMQLLGDGGLRLRTIVNSNLLIRNSPNTPGEDDNIGIDFIRDDAPDNTTTNIKARIQFDGYPLSYPALQWLHKGYIRFFTNDNYGLSQRMVITPEGNVGIGSEYTYPIATAVVRPFEVSCLGQPVRFKNLPSGTGSVLVIDANGDVRVSSTTAKIATASNSSNVTALQEEVNTLKKQLADMKARLERLEKSN